MIRADFHCHTNASHDCFAPPAAVLETARRRGLTHLAITDHDQLEGAWRTRDLSRELQIIIGCEVSLAGGVHLVGLFLRQPVTAKTPLEVVAEIQAQGGLVFLPHPFHPHAGALAVGLTDQLLAAVDAIEVCNGHEPAARNTLALDLARAYQRPQLAGSDAHYGIDVGRAGVLFPGLDGELTPDQLRQAPRRLFGPTQDISEVHATDARVRASSLPRARRLAPKAARRIAKWLLWKRFRHKLKARLKDPVCQEYLG